MINRSNFSDESFKKVPVVGIVRNIDADTINEIVPLYQKAGLTTLEITMNTENAPQIIKSLSSQYPGLNIGAGTVIEMSDLETALEAGASFIVTPVLNKEVIQFCHSNQIPVFPGALTPTEVYKAWKWGAHAVKIFPATQFGAAYVKELKAPLNKINLLPTGGVSLDNLESFFKAGATGVGMGSTLFNKDLIAKKDFETLFVHFQKIVEKVSSFNNIP